MSEVFKDEEVDFERFWDWWADLRKYAQEILAPSEDGTKHVPLPLQMMVAAYAAANWKQHKDSKWEKISIVELERRAKTLQAQLREKGREVSKLKARLKRRKGSKKQSKEGKIND